MEQPAWYNDPQVLSMLSSMQHIEVNYTKFEKLADSFHESLRTLVVVARMLRQVGTMLFLFQAIQMQSYNHHVADTSSPEAKSQ
jgi:hypothetical protein